MSEELNHKTFDLIGVLSGRDYPSLEVPVYFDESLGFAINTLVQAVESAIVLGETEKADEIQVELDNLVKQTEDSKYIVHLKSIPEAVKRDILEKVQEEFPPDEDFLGKPKHNPKSDAEFTKRLWLAYIQSVEAPDGSKAPVSREEIDKIYDLAPQTALEAINRGIGQLQQGAKSGFEYAAKEVDFLLTASPEG